jgi:hypothetical protein
MKPVMVSNHNTEFDYTYLNETIDTCIPRKDDLAWTFLFLPCKKHEPLKWITSGWEIIYAKNTIKVLKHNRNENAFCHLNEDAGFTNLKCDEKWCQLERSFGFVFSTNLHTAENY